MFCTLMALMSRFAVTVGMPSDVPQQTAGIREPFAANQTFKRFLARVTSPVSLQVTAAAATFATFGTLVFTAVHVDVRKQAALRREAFLTLRT